MINTLAVIGILTLSCVLVITVRALYLRHTTGLWPSALGQRVRDAENQALQNAHKVLLARTERDLQSKINGQAAEIDCLKSRIKDLESDIENLRDGKDAVEDAFLTFLTSLKE